MRIGVHVSISGSIDKSIDRAVDLGCNTIQIFSSNPRGWRSKPLSDKEVETYIGLLEKVRGKAFELANPGAVMEDVQTKEIEKLVRKLSK